MNIPFSLKFLNKLDYFQVLLKLNKQFKTQVFKMENESALPLWQAEMKILYWTYSNHKYLGHTLKVRDFKVDSESKRGDEMSLSNEEALKIRDIFGNLVSRGYAYFTPGIDYYDEQPRPNGFVLQIPVLHIHTTQENCQGIIINKEGLIFGELLNELYSIQELKGKRNKIVSKYAQKTNIKKYLYPKKLKWTLYNFIIFVGYITLLLICLYILREFYEILKMLFHYFVI